MGEERFVYAYVWYRVQTPSETPPLAGPLSTRKHIIHRGVGADDI